MSAPLPDDPLDDLITQFVASVNRFLDREDFKVDPPAPPRNILDLLRIGETIKRQVGKMHQVWSGAEPEVKERLQSVISLGSAVIDLTDDRFIVGPVEALVRMASEEQVAIGSMIERMGGVSSFGDGMQLILELTGFTMQNDERRKAISAELDSLTAYYVLQLPPRDPA